MSNRLSERALRGSQQTVWRVIRESRLNVRHIHTYADDSEYAVDSEPMTYDTKCPASQGGVKSCVVPLLL